MPTLPPTPPPNPIQLPGPSQGPPAPVQPVQWPLPAPVGTTEPVQPLATDPAPATANRWQIGAMYFQGNLNGALFFTQPGGVGTEVYPTQQNAQPWLSYPIPGLVIQEYVPWWTPACGHAIKEWSVIREWDYETGQSCALICCSICSFVQNVYEPFEEWLNPIAHTIIVA